jgi:hypothetical protein
VNYQAVRDGFTKINNMVKVLKLRGHPNQKPVGIPMIGSLRAGGHWEAIKTIIDLVTPDVNIELVVYKP